MKTIVLSWLLCAILMVSCNDSKVVKDPVSFENGLNSDIHAFIKSQMKIHEIPGLAIAVIGKDGIVHKGFYGKESLQGDEPITNKTVFKIFSLTKTIVATSVFKLVEEGKISLNDKLSDYFENLPSPWMTVTIANLLSHSSGLPDIRKYDKELADDAINDEQFIALLYDDEMDFVTGEDWSYNQTNYILLKRLIEKVTYTSFETFIMDHQFAKVDSANVFFMSGPSVAIKNGANYYNFDKTLNLYKKKPEHSGRKNHPLAGLNTTLDEYIAWNNRLDNDILLNETTKKLMWQPYKFSNSNRNFLHGWDVYDVNGHDSFGFSGGGVSGFRKFLDKDLSIIVLTTGYKYYAVQDIIIDHIAGMIDSDLKDDETELKEHLIAKFIKSGDSLDMKDIVTRAKIENPNQNLESTFKALGYRLFFDLDRKKDAITLFELNVLEYPQSYDTYGSLAYLQYLTDEFENSRKNYMRAKELNPDNPYSDRRIKEIDVILEERR